MFYRGGIDVAVMRKSSLRTVPLGSYGVEFTAFAIVRSFLKNGTITKMHIPGMERASDFHFQRGMEGCFFVFY